MVLCSGVPQGGFCNVGCVHCCFCDVWCCSSFIAVFVILVVVLHSLLFDVKPYPSLSYCRVFRPILYFQPSSLQGNSWQFHFNLSGPFFTVSPRALRFWAGIFYPQAVFLRSFPTFLPQPAFLKVSLGGGNSFLKFAGVHADPQNTDPAHLFVWFTAIRNLDIQKNSYLNRTKYYHKLLVVKSLFICSLIVSNLFCLFKVIYNDHIKHFEQVLYCL